MAGEMVRGWKSQNRPWWAITSCAPASAARSISSRLADTPVATSPTSCEPGTCRPFGPWSEKSARVEELVEKGDDRVA